MNQKILLDAGGEPRLEVQGRYLELIEAHRKMLHKLAYLYCRRPEDRRDLIQDILVQLWRSFGTFDGRVSFSTWMYRVALNVAISFYRSERRQVSDTISLEECGIDFHSLDLAYGPDTDDMRTLQRLIEQLDEMSRSLIMLFLEGFSHEEIAGVLGISTSNVGTRLARIKQKLRDSIDLI
jgi:RNA polymerase sigma-70 factor (ECF subfamily)